MITQSDVCDLCGVKAMVGMIYTSERPVLDLNSMTVCVHCKHVAIWVERTERYLIVISWGMPDHGL